VAQYGHKGGTIWGTGISAFTTVLATRNFEKTRFNQRIKNRD
jgi:hypothetical protein